MSSAGGNRLAEWFSENTAEWYSWRTILTDIGDDIKLTEFLKQLHRLLQYGKIDMKYQVNGEEYSEFMDIPKDANLSEVVCLYRKN